MSASQEVIPAQKAPSLVAKFADRYGVEANKLIHTLKATCFKGDVSTEQLMALLIVADQHGLNPWTKEIHAFDDRRGGIVPVVGVDGWARIVNEHPAFDGMDFEQDDEKCTCRMYRKDRAHPVVVTEWMAECKRPQAGPWATHPKRMLRHKAMIQCARIAFSFAGIYDSDEAERIIEATAVDVTDDLDLPANTQAQKIGPKRLRELVEAIETATKANDAQGVLKAFKPLSNEERLFLWPHLRSWERSATKKLLAEAEKADQGMQLDAWSKSLLRECKTDAELTDAFKAISEAYEANGVTEVPEEIVLVCDEMRQSMGAA